MIFFFFFFSSRRRHTRFSRDWSSDVCSSDLGRHGVVPDLVTLAKGIGSGFPMGAVLVSEQIAATVRPEDYGTTFGGGPLACAAAEATVRVILEEGLLGNVRAGSRR